ncbi:hypothetical protein AVEN_186613-1 [Araneus ventricosus]|uniref:Uncharacterized protein n=1 Tax=Araneus ventricosus TaxID=182803 RepID=A0A4Y2FBB7_ARAVE|nr:hypothetical protein AVEN_186613-1 [Araneus ventricosus]
MFCRTVKARRSLCHVFSLHVSRNAASRDWSNGKNNLRGLRESHAFIRADVTGDEEAACTRMILNNRVPGIRVGLIYLTGTSFGHVFSACFRIIRPLMSLNQRSPD